MPFLPLIQCKRYLWQRPRTKIWYGAWLLHLPSSNLCFGCNSIITLIPTSISNWIMLMLCDEDINFWFVQKLIYVAQLCRWKTDMWKGVSMLAAYLNVELQVWNFSWALAVTLKAASQHTNVFPNKAQGRVRLYTDKWWIDNAFMISIWRQVNVILLLPSSKSCNGLFINGY